MDIDKLKKLREPLVALRLTAEHAPEAWFTQQYKHIEEVLTNPYFMLFLMLEAACAAFSRLPATELAKGRPALADEIDRLAALRDSLPSYIAHKCGDKHDLFSVLNRAIARLDEAINAEEERAAVQDKA